jgi:imidazolonepropionase-like amidohydrolase
MKPFILLIQAVITMFFFSCTSTKTQDKKDDKNQRVVFKNVNLLSGDGSAAKKSDVFVENGKIAEISSNLVEEDASIVDLTGKTMMPALISTHVHIGTLKDTVTNAGNYTRENIFNQLNKYAAYGVLNVQSLGTDQPFLFQNGLYDSIKNGLLDGARMLSAGYGFNIPQANINPASPMNKLFRPVTAAQVPAEMDSLAALNIKIVKIWVDDFNKTLPKMDPEVYHAIINEAHKRNIRVAAHVYYLSDARRLVSDGVDILAHSIRDSIVDDAFLAEMKSKQVIYVPTLTLDKFSYVYAGEPEWINDPFFKASLEPGTYEMITSEKYKNDTKNSPAYARNENGFKTAMANLKKIFDAGIPVALGTDSGAFPIRTQGFSEHLEMQLLTEAGLTPLQAIRIATKNAADALGLNDYGVIEKGKVADLLILDGDPSVDIKNTRKISVVYKNGIKVQ